MLMVSDLLEVARGNTNADALALANKDRFHLAATRSAQKHPPRAPVIVWNVNRQCNMTCPHCYAAANNKPAKGQLTTEEGIHLLDDLAANGVKVIIFSGGEPLMRQDLLKLIAHARDLGMRPNLSTNGTLIDSLTAERLAQAGTRYVGISIDGTRDFNDAYRGLVGGHGLAVAGLKHAKAQGMHTGLRMTLTRGNMGMLEEMVALAVDIDVNRFYVSHLVYAGRGFQMARDDLAPEDTRGLLENLFAMAETLLDKKAPTRVVTGSNDSDGPLLLHWIARTHGHQPAARVEALLRQRGGNSAGEGLLAIDFQGRVHPDQFWQREVLGRMPLQSFAEILEHPLRAQLRDRQKLLGGRCGKCRYLDVCRGSHRERAIARHRDMWASDPACVMRDEEVFSAPDENIYAEPAPKEISL